MGFPSRASEFPNDNAAISSGAIWICASVTGAAKVELSPFEPVPSQPFVFWFEEEEPYLDGPVDIDLAPDSGKLSVHVPLEPAVAEPDAPEPAVAEPDVPEPAVAEPELPPAFAHFEAALVSALLAQGATRSAALLPRLLRLEPLPADALGKNVELTLQSRGYLDGNARYSQKFRELCGAWGAVLRGASQDFAACGTTTLDRFGAELLAALLAVPTTRADDLRRELRKAGVAAFGVLAAA
ncbi:MAG TPA: hypothetical protein VIW29_17525 [Polyangiaceae bacterium]